MSRCVPVRPNDVWAVGASGTILHWDGDSWADKTIEAADVHGFWGSGPNDV